MTPETLAEAWAAIEPLIGGVEANTPPPGCRRWLGEYTRYADHRAKQPTVYVHGRIQDPRRVLLAREGVVLDNYARLGATCGDALCMERSHIGIRPLGSRPGTRPSSSVPPVVQLVEFRSGSVHAFTPFGHFEGASMLSVCAEVEARRVERQERERFG